MFLDIDLLTVGQETFHLLGEDGGGGKAANELQAGPAALRPRPLDRSKLRKRHPYICER